MVNHGLSVRKDTFMLNFANKIPPAIVTLLSFFMMWGIVSFKLFELDWIHVLSPYLSVILLILSILLLLFASYSFYKSKTSLNPISPENASPLVTSVVYRISRNPMYAGFLLLLVAWWLYLGELLSVIGCLFFISYLNKFQIESEERVLEKLFGEEYRLYKSRVRRWF